MNTTCNKTHSCNCECQNHISCPLDNVPEIEKDRSVARNRHHGKEKAKQNLKSSAKILESKAKRIPDTASSYWQVERAAKRTEQAQKRASKIK